LEFQVDPLVLSGGQCPVIWSEYLLVACIRLTGSPFLINQGLMASILSTLIVVHSWAMSEALFISLITGLLVLQ
jgi:hypothetical protein